MTEPLPPDSSPNPLPRSPAPPASSVIRSEALLGGQKEILIEHAGEMYRLRLTRNGKLILQK